MKIPGKTAVVALLLAGDVFAQRDAAPSSWLRNLSVAVAASAHRVENISRTSAESFHKDADTYEFSLVATRREQLAPSWLLQAGAEASYLSIPDYDLGNHVKFGPRLGLQHKFGLGPLAPVLQFDTALTYKSARLADDRGWGAEASLRLAKRLTTGFKAGLIAHWLEHNARSRVFDLQQRSFSADITWDLNERWSLSGSAGQLTGDVVANAPWAVWGQALGGGLGAAIFNYYTARPWKVTDLFGPGWVSYNVEADVDLWSLAATCAITDHTSAQLRYSSAFVVSKIGVRYPTDSWGLSVVHRF